MPTPRTSRREAPFMASRCRASRRGPTALRTGRIILPSRRCRGLPRRAQNTTSSCTRSEALAYSRALRTRMPSIPAARLAGASSTRVGTQRQTYWGPSPGPKTRRSAPLGRVEGSADARAGLRVAFGDAWLDLSWTVAPGTVTGHDAHYTASATVAVDAALHHRVHVAQHLAARWPLRPPLRMS